jgi:hypothetical protein
MISVLAMQFLALVLTLTASAGAFATAEEESGGEGKPSEKQLRQLGERMYRQGSQTDGKPMRAIVAGDVLMDGRMFTCVNCHRRSGLGSEEGSVITWPINGKELFIPRRRTGAWNPKKANRGPGAIERWTLPPQYRAADARPAYTDESLARLIRTGIDPAGRKLSSVMPRYVMEDGEMAVLIAYLKTLSAATDPGADGETIRFATVITDEVPKEERDAMLSVLQAHIDARNTQTRPHLRRARRGPFYKTEKYGAYRKLELDVWELQGPAHSWRDQLEAYYQARPVFALLGGISSADWAPIHEFSEAHEIPSIFPLTDRPVVSDSDWYTLYFSKGLYQEGEAAARFLSSGKGAEGRPLLQLYRPGSAGESIARGFRETWQKLGGSGLVDRPLPTGEALTDQGWRDLFAGHPSPVVLLWLDGEEVAAAIASGELAAAGTIFASSGLLGDKPGLIPEQMRDTLFLTHPRSLPGENGIRLRVVQRWLKARGIPATHLDIQARMYFLGWMLPGAIKYLRSEFYRDYFLEGFDMMTDQNYAIAVYPRLSFGPGQRYASKGCYIVRLGPGDAPDLIKASRWVIN